VIVACELTGAYAERVTQSLTKGRSQYGKTEKDVDEDACCARDQDGR
jgi:hypothetical protein